MARIAERLVLELAPGLLFMFPTVASLSGELMQGKQKVGRTEFDQVQQSSGLTVSKQEEQFWLLNRMSGELGTYQPLAAIRCSGGVSVERLREAVGAVVRKYEIFRTVYRESADRLKPMVQANVEAPVSHLASPHGVELDEWAAEHLQQAARCKFNLATDVPLRVFFYSGDDGRSVIGFVFQHIAMDGLSFPLLWESLAQAYRDPDFDDDPAGSYRAYAQRQETRLQPDRLAAMRLFWHEHLQGNSAALDLPFDGLGTDSCEAYQQLQTIPAEVSEGLSRVARSNACSENSLYLAAYFAWLARYTNHESAVVGLPVSIRPDTADKDVIGCCINTICLSQPVSPTTRFSELVGAIQKLMAAALPHAEYPIARLTGELCRHSGEDRRLFQTLFQYRYFRRELAGLEDEGAEMIPLSESITDLPLTMEIVPPSSGPAQVAIMVNTACFSPGTAGRMLEHFCCLLRSIATNPDQEIRQYELVSSEERRRLLFEFNQTARLHDTEPNLWLRTRSALLKRSGESVVRFDGTHSDGPELVRRAEAIAAGLQQHGVRIGDRVGIYLNRSLDLVPALLGILANGAAYVPLDPESPVERNRFILADADVAVLLSENQLRDQLPQCECPVLCLESIESKDRFQAVSIGKNDLAYILYTSGSTGRPKGVAVEHGNVLNLLEAMAEAPGFKPGDRLLALTTICFDISVVELFLPLVKGGVVIVGREQLRLDPPELARTMMSEAVSIFQATPATYEMLCHSGWKPGPELKLYCGGEALSPRLADQLLANGASLWNIYGPTEATVYALGKRILPAERILIGRPLANMEAYVVDAAGMLAPTGVAGELLVGGQGVARGYWKRDELTADRFIRLELEGLPARRVYRTGDRARVLSNGEVEFLGRQDRQIKIRGHRIELGEIEQCLRRLSGVQRVIVEVRPSTAGDPRLVAYVAPRLLKQRQRELADSLAASLPSYMLPSAWFFLDDFPLTPNRKIDTSRLPSPKDATENESARPTTDLEKSIERIWAELLGVNSIGLDDNFFELGGHSLLAVRLVSRMETELRRPISLNLLFRHATIRKLGAAIESVATVNSTLVPLRNGAGPPVYFVHGFTGHVLGHIDFVKHFPEGLQVVGVQAVEHVGEPRQESFESMGARYARDICEHQPDGPIYLCGYSLGGLIAFETARQLLSLGRKIGGVVVLDTATRNLPRFVYYRGLSAYLIRRAFHHARCMISAPEGIFSFLRGRCRAMLNRLRRTPAAPTAQNPNQPAPVDPYQRVGFRYFPQPAEIAVSVLITGQYPELVRATWRYLAGGGVSENRHDALHLELLQDADLARELGRSLLEMRSVSD
ncbi:MAG: non-ribosomal peptide synthetase [Limisphaerales bacterium]